MAARSIGSTTFNLVYFRVPGTKTRSVVWEVNGVNGYGLLLIGKSDAAFDIETISYLDGANAGDWSGANTAANTLIGTCEGYQGTLQTVVDAFNNSTENVFIQECSVADPLAQKACIHGGKACNRVLLHWKCLNTNVS